MTIYDIKRDSEAKSPYFFTRNSMRFFGQTLRDFSVKKQPDGRFLISAPMRDRFNNNKLMGHTKRYFNPENNELERE